MERVRKWSAGVYYTAGGIDEEYGDIVYEEGSKIPYECVVSHTSVASEPPSVLAVHSDPSKRYWRAGEYRYMVANDIMLSRLISASEIDVNNLSVAQLETKSLDATIRIKDGLMEVFGSVNKNEPNIRFGINDNGYAVLQYFDNEGRFLYDLGPNGISMIDVREQKWITYRRYYLGSVDSNVISSQGYIGILYEDGADVYKYVSKVVAGKVSYPELDGRYYASNGVDTDGAPTGNQLSGWYCWTASKGADVESFGEYIYLLDADGNPVPPSDLSEYNPSLDYGADYIIYFKNLEHYTDGVLDTRQNVYWSVRKDSNNEYF